MLLYEVFLLYVGNFDFIYCQLGCIYMLPLSPKKVLWNAICNLHISSDLVVVMFIRNGNLIFSSAVEKICLNCLLLLCRNREDDL